MRLGRILPSEALFRWNKKININSEERTKMKINFGDAVLEKRVEKL